MATVDRIVECITSYHDPFSRSDSWQDAYCHPTEHVLRASKSFAARSFRSRPSVASIRITSTRSNNENLSVGNNASDFLRQQLSLADAPTSSVVLGEIAPNNQLLRSAPFASTKYGPSPTPSMKRKKAEAIVKAHGSPQHLRVTAGGRIVPSEQSPLCHPRYGYSAINLNGGLIKFAPNSQAGNPQWTKATEDGFVAQDINGNLCQIVHGTVLPLTEVDGAMRLYMPAPNLNVTQRPSPGLVNTSAPTNGSSTQPREAAQSKAVNALEPSISSQITALELEYTKLDLELKELDKTEVRNGRMMSKFAKDTLVARRRELVVNMDRLRKAVKELKSQPPPNAPTSPRAMAGRPAVSPPRNNRLPHFLQAHHTNNPSLSHGYAGFPVAPPPAFGGHYGGSMPPAPEDAYAGHAWAALPPGLFIPPPTYDGAMASSFPIGQPQMAVTTMPANPNIPQSDGARSMVDSLIGSPNGRSRALSIKVPEASKPTMNTKSNLNPMSPEYRPGSDSAKTSANVGAVAKDNSKTADFGTLPAVHQLEPGSQRSHKAANASTDTISPSKKNNHVHSSSISSVETANFFPNNTREYSTRPHAYPVRLDPSDSKENNHPDQDKSYSPQIASFQATPAPPGTPILPPDALPEKIDGYREAHNVSPKHKREWLFVQEHPEQPECQPLPSSSPVKSHICQDDICVTSSPLDTIDFADRPREWIEGYQAGLQRRPVGADRMGQFLDGYCSGLLKSKPEVPTSTGPFTGSPIKTHSRRPSPALQHRTSNHFRSADQETIQARPPFENAMKSMDTLKQAVFAPQNENAVRTRAPEGPHIDEVSNNLGTWAETHGGAATTTDPLASFPFPQRTSSVVKQHRVMSEDSTRQEMGKFQDPRRVTDLSGPYLGPRSMDRFINYQPTSPALSTTSIASGSTAGPETHAHRISSLTSIDSNLSRGQWHGHRIITPQEWKSSSSVAHAAGLATGYFAHAQFDGTNDCIPNYPGPELIGTGPPQPQRVTSITSDSTVPKCAQPTTGRFHEGSLDGVEPPMSPSLPANSPNGTPNRVISRKQGSSPSKGSSPAKAKFEHIAEKVGIKVSGSHGGSRTNDGTFEPGSPPGKRRWRAVWRKGGARDESA
ncbi:hypothetical protein TI39_contig297g00013 [Zymoseptoria brevis]|uniref:Uncharacterized protein n=1 Tax=Zymoseptoria brevis TaxID=1047168 RepID=A0A0F4GW62_9PEZI|nr:hypothetical protein TI39_contig297g00013 [Zymoseptoria brevis]